MFDIEVFGGVQTEFYTVLWLNMAFSRICMQFAGYLNAPVFIFLATCLNAPICFYVFGWMFECTNFFYVFGWMFECTIFFIFLARCLNAPIFMFLAGCLNGPFFKFLAGCLNAPFLCFWLDV